MGSTPEEIEAILKILGGDLELRKRIQSEDGEWRERIRREGPQHKVILSRPLYVGVTEVTQSQYEQIIENNPSHFSSVGNGKELMNGLKTGNHPVERVNWYDAAGYCEKLSQREKLKPFYLRAGDTVTPIEGTGYRLPTEAEWEYACRAGTVTQFWSGDDVKDLMDVGWTESNSDGRTHAVGELRANPFGLYDVYGNVLEWAQDGWDPAFYLNFLDHIAVDPCSPFPPIDLGVIRGGNWPFDPYFCRSSDRSNTTALAHYPGVGFRVALSVDAVRQTLKPNDVGPNSTETATTTPAYKWPADQTAPAIAPFTAEEANAHQEAWAKHLGVPVEYENSIGMKFRLIPPGEFLMGSTLEQIEPIHKFSDNDYNRKAIQSEAPQH